MSTIGLLVKSYRDDFGMAARLVDSLDRYNDERLPTWIVVPDDDLALFRPLERPHQKALPESVLGQYLVDRPVAGIRPGYINQEIVKLAAWELGLAENLFPIDSDAVMLRPFGREDLMYDGTTPYTVLVEDRELEIDPTYYAQHWQGREASLRRIQRLLGLDDRRLLTCHGHQVLSSHVLKSLKQDFLEPRGWSYADMLEEAPYEFSWYNFWLQKSNAIPIYQREPFIKAVHSVGQHMELAIRGITPADIARGYLGIVINSNFARSWGESDIGEPPEATLARYLSWRSLAGTAKAKAASALRRRLRGDHG